MLQRIPGLFDPAMIRRINTGLNPLSLLTIPYSCPFFHLLSPPSPRVDHFLIGRYNRDYRNLKIAGSVLRRNPYPLIFRRSRQVAAPGGLSLECSLFGLFNDVAMPIVGVGFIISVIQDSLETALNSSGDVIFTATAEFMDWKKKGKELPF